MNDFLNKKKKQKNKTGEILEALPNEISGVGNPANGIPFIYVKNLEGKVKKELYESLVKLGVSPAVEENVADDVNIPVLSDAIQDALEKGVEAHDALVHVLESEDLEKAGVKKVVQRPALFTLLASLGEKIQETLQMGGYAAEKGKKEKMKKSEDDSEVDASIDADATDENQDLNKGENPMTDEQINALVETKVAEALSKSKVDSEGVQATGEAAASSEVDGANEAQESALEKKVGELESTITSLTNEIQTTLKDDAESKSELEKKVEALTKTAEGLQEQLKVVKSVRSGNSQMVDPAEPTGEALEKKNNLWSGTSVSAWAKNKS